MSDLLAALGLALVIEGVLYSLFPEAMKKMMTSALTQPSNALRVVGLMTAVVGVGIVWLVRG